MKTLRLCVDGMYCAACSVEIERALLALPGVLAADVSVPECCAVVRYEEGHTSPPQITKAIQGLGYTARSYTHGSAFLLKRQKADRLLRMVTVSLLLSLPLAADVPLRLKAVLATAVQFYAGAGFYREAFYGLRGKTLNMSFMVAFSTSCTWAYSLYAMANADNGQIYFDSGALILTMILAGRLVEARLNMRAGSVLESLYALMPQKARVADGEGDVWRDLSRISAGDTILVQKGERIPLDAVVVSGAMLVDESMLTGEAAPRAKAAGDTVLAGTLNTQGDGLLRVTTDTSHTVLSGIIADVSRSLSGKSRVQTLTDRVTQIFCPAVIAVAAIAAGLWITVLDPGNSSRAMRIFVSAVVVACPCALGFSAPLATAGAVSAAAENGVLIRETGAIEALARLHSVGFDKTGTLTNGKFSISEILLLHADSAEELMLHAAIAEKTSLHPLAQAVIRYVGRGPAELPDAQTCQAHPGRGVVIRWEGHQYTVGSLAFAREKGAPAADLDRIQNQLAGRSGSVLVVLRDDIVEGACFLQDTVRDDARAALTALQQRGITCYMMTGDHAQAAKDTARLVGITEWYSGLLPDQKAAVLRQKQLLGAAAMVGDGLNDLSTLSCADVGFAVSNAAWPADTAAGVVLLDNRLDKIPFSIAVSQKAMLIIRQNLLISCLYNLSALGMAVCGLLTPVIAAAAMSASSLSVVVNSQRVRRMRP